MPQLHYVASGTEGTTCTLWYPREPQWYSGVLLCLAGYSLGQFCLPSHKSQVGWHHGAWAPLGTPYPPCGPRRNVCQSVCSALPTSRARAPKCTGGRIRADSGGYGGWVRVGTGGYGWVQVRAGSE
jgi:hypothetical protein